MFNFAYKVILLVSICLLTTHAIAVDFYKWTDENGSTHYSTTPPVQQSTKKQKVETRLSRFDKILVAEEHQPNGGRFDDTQLAEPPVQIEQKITPHQAVDTKPSMSQVPLPTLDPAMSIEPKNSESAANQSAQKSDSTQNSQNPPTETVNVAPAREQGTYRPISNPNRTTVLAHCDNKGCWGTDGVRYTRTTGDNFLDPNKKECMIFDKKMRCF